MSKIKKIFYSNNNKIRKTTIQGLLQLEQFVKEVLEDQRVSEDSEVLEDWEACKNQEVRNNNKF